MKVMIIGAAGMIGRKLTGRLMLDGQLGGRPIDELILCDTAPSELPADSSFTVVNLVADLTAPGQAKQLIDYRPDVVFHLAALAQ